MAKQRDRAAWARTFAVLAQIANANMGPGGDPIDPMKFFPWSNDDAEGRQAPPPTESDRAALRARYPGGGKKKGVKRQKPFMENVPDPERKT